MSEQINLSINTQLSFNSYQEAVSAKLALIKTIEAILEHPVDFGFVRDAFTISSITTDEKDSVSDQWIRDFLKTNKPNDMNDDMLYDFACALCDDIPFGYESSHRVANMLFIYLARKHGFK